jgi:hypothetical protein
MKQLLERSRADNARTPGWWQNVFILCSGADKELLKDCPTEWNKFAGIGATILLTACLALLSGAYAMNFVFDNGWYSVLFGVFWAIVIFNLDRYIVLSLRKEKIPSKAHIASETDPTRKAFLTNERKTLRLNQLKMASPRFIIALIIAITVSKPIELRLFNNRIERELENIVKSEDQRFDVDEQARVDSLKAQLASINSQEQNDKDNVFSSNPIYTDAKERIPQIENEISSKQAAITANTKIINANQVKEKRTRRQLGEAGPYSVEYYVWVPNSIARSKIDENRNLQKEKQQLDKERSELISKKNTVETTLGADANAVSSNYQSVKDNIAIQIKQLNDSYAERKNRWKDANRRSTDLPARLEALGNISKFNITPGNEAFFGNSIWLASLVITLLFISLETAPVVVKLLTKRGPYDEKLDAEEYRIFIEESKKVDTLNREINDYMLLANESSKLSGTLRLAAEKDKLEVELSNNKILLTKIAGYQKHLADIYAEAWFDEEKGKAQMQVKGYYNQSQHKNKLEGAFWRQKDGADTKEYFFRNHLPDNELLYFENGEFNRGKWMYNSKSNELTIDIQGREIQYGVFEVNDRSLKLIEKSSNHILELEKV